MIIMGPKKDRGGAVAHILQGMSESSHEKLKKENEQMSHAGMEDKTRHESLDAAANALMDALRAGNVSDLQNSLKSFIELVQKQD